MAGILGKRRFHAFLSHAHVDKGRADELVEWLRDVSGAPVWYDAVNLPPGATIAEALPAAIEGSRSLILLLSKESVTRGWVQLEYGAAINHQTRHPAFRIIPVRLDDVNPPGFLQNYSNIVLDPEGLDSTSAAGILKGLYQPATSIDPANGRNVYVSRGWHLDDGTLAEVVCVALEEAGLQLIGDAEDQLSWIEGRVAGILEGCGAFAAVLPYRAQSLHARLNEARPQSSVVLVDCCFSGAFVHGGLRSRAARRPVDVEGLVRDPPPGKARAVLTASTATQLSFEDDVSRAEAAARPSYFTEAVIAALRTGAADRDRDGRISVDDLYSFVYDRVTRAGHGQEPQRAIYGAGELVIAYAGQHEPEPPLPPEPPDSDLTLVIEPDMPLAPWPPLPGDAAAPRRAQDHAAFHTSPQQPPRPPQPYVAPPDPTEPVSAPSRWQLRPLSWSMLALGLALVLLAGFALWGLLRPRPATRVPTPAVSPTMPRNLEDGIADFGTSFVATGQEGPFDLNTLARFFGRDAERYRSALKKSGLRRGYARTLRSSDGELMGIVLMELGSPPAAQAVQQWFGVCGDRPATDFDVPAIPGAIARACVGDAGRAVQEVIFTRGLLLYKVKLDRIREPRLTGQIVELAGVQAKKAGH